MIDQVAETIFDILGQYPRIMGALLGAMLHPVFSWLIR